MLPAGRRARPLTINDADRSLIRHLQKDARASYRELGEASGLSPSGARLRFERLVSNGTIKIVGIPVRAGQPETPTLRLDILQACQSTNCCLDSSCSTSNSSP